MSDSVSRTELPSSTTMHKPKEHDGKTVSGEHDKRTDSDHGLGSADRDAVETGRKGGKAGTMEQTAERYGGDFATSAEQAE
ncbi:hypothetical protein ACM66B_004165 [Microbotryomycetes sp. NB124-2]